ncbi:helix-turn-helix transcriptional regulator [Flavobacterium sp.]|uniref:helix-turn-helix transcriptional regulator n=1 Tax=Flavobacterium sp. TaxID=239 RepID=UPI00404719C7
MNTNETIIIEKLNKLETLLVSSIKQILTVEDLINYTGFSRSYIYKLVHKNVIPYSKPNGKTLFFQKNEIDSFLLQNKSASISQIEQKAINYTAATK